MTLAANFAGLPPQSQSFALGHPHGKVPIGHIPAPLKLPPPSPKIRAAGFRLDESNCTRCYADTTWRFDGVWNASSFSENREPTGNMPMAVKSHPSLWQPDKLRFAKEIYRTQTNVPEQRRQGIPGTRTYVPGQAAETVFGKTDREMKDTCLKMRPYNLERNGVVADATEGELKAEYMNVPPIRAPTKRSAQKIFKSNPMIFSASFGRFAQHNRENCIPSTYQGTKDHKIPPRPPPSYAKWGITGYSGCIPNVNAESGSMGGTYQNVLKYAEGLDVSKAQNTRISTCIPGATTYVPARSAETVYGKTFAHTTNSSLQQREYART